MSLKPRKIIKGIFVMLGIVAVFMGILVAGFIYVTEYKIHVISDSFSADRTYRLEIDQVGDPAWPYGSTDCRLVLYSKEDEKIREKISRWLMTGRMFQRIIFPYDGKRSRL